MICFSADFLYVNLLGGTLEGVVNDVGGVFPWIFNMRIRALKAILQRPLYSFLKYISKFFNYKIIKVFKLL